MNFERELLALRPRLLALARKKCRSRTDAEDLCQETMLKAWKGRETFNGDNFAAWCFTIMVNVQFSQFRKSQIATRYLMEVDVEKVSLPVQEQAVLFRQVQGLLQDKINAEQRTAMIWLAMGYENEEVAALTGVAVGTVKSRAHRGREKLKALCS